jgi:DNA-binding LytR/AlgR family response regulator
MSMPSALIADDEPLLRDALAARLKDAWPELRLVAMARNGREAVELFERHRPDICFLDVHMPGMNGVEAATLIGRRAHLVFVTAFDQYALPAFDAGAVDYLMKPVQAARVAQTVSRLQDRLRSTQPPTDLAAVLAALQPPAPLRWIRASVGNTIKLIDVEAIDYLRADAKYTRVAWRDAHGQPCAALIRTPL